MPRSRKPAAKLLPSVVAKRIGVPAAEWPGRCYEIACKMLCHGVVQGVARYGSWLGPVLEACPVVSWRGSRLPVRHGWIERPDGSIVDPTRWVFAGAKPEIYVGPSDLYDVGANVLRAMRRRPCPRYDVNDPRPEFQLWKLDVNAHRWLMGTLFADAPGITTPMLFWLANLPLADLGQHASSIYRAIVESGNGHFIPIDNRTLVLP